MSNSSINKYVFIESAYCVFECYLSKILGMKYETNDLMEVLIVAYIAANSYSVVDRITG